MLFQEKSSVFRDSKNHKSSTCRSADLRVRSARPDPDGWFGVPPRAPRPDGQSEKSLGEMAGNGFCCRKQNQSIHHIEYDHGFGGEDSAVGP